MKVVVQRCTHATVRVAGNPIGSIGHGLLLLVGFGEEDSESALQPMADKVAHLRIFSNEQGRFDRSVLDIGGEILVVSQFTLYADTAKGRRPEFFKALHPSKAEPLFNAFVKALEGTGVKRVAQGSFGAYMQVELENDGPVTIILER